MEERIVDANTGTIRISDKFIISRQTVPKMLFDYFGNDSLKMSDMKNGYIHYNTSDISLNNTFFRFTLVFYKDQLESVSWIYDYIGESWDNWSQEKELNREKKYQDWLTQQIGTQRKFSWGIIWANFDRKGGSTSVGLRYG